MGKSKKTLALVMALVMAFTIVPFGAWYGFKAAAESPDTHALDYYVPAKELKDGQSYIIVSPDTNYVLTHTPFGAGETWSVTSSYQWNPAVKMPTDVAKLATWKYVMDKDDKVGRFSMADANDSDGVVYLDIRDPKNGNDIISYYKTDNKFAIVNKGNGQYTLQRTDKYYTYVSYDGNGKFVPVANESTVYLYEVRTDLPETIEFPIIIRDLHKDDLLVDYGDPAEVFNLTSKDSNIKVSNDGGHINSKLLDFAGDQTTTTSTYRTGLTQKYLKDDKLQYSPYAVIYVAHALREHYNVGAFDYRRSGNFSFNNTPLADALRDKYTDYQDHNVQQGMVNTNGHTEKRPTKDTGDSFESALFKDSVDSFYTTLQNTEVKKKVDAFFETCDDDVYATYDDALTAAQNATGLTGKNAEILADYAYTISHAKKLTYNNIVNKNPSYDGRTSVSMYSYNAIHTKWTWNDPVPYDEPGASFMDVAWYMLHHFFEDTADNAVATNPDIVNSNYNGEKNFQYFSKTVENAPKAIELKRLIKEDGSVSYIYNSAFTSNFADANATTPLKNNGLEQNTYTGIYSGDANFYPIDGMEFGNSGTGNHGDKNYPHNYGFSLQGSGKFVYNYDEELFFEFSGDDDVFLYINNIRVDEVDLGGSHTPVTGRIDLNKFKDKYGLEDGHVYDFDFFYMERNPTGSNFKMETNIRVMSEDLIPQKNAYSQVDCNNSKRIPYEGVVGRGDKIFYEFVATNSLPNTEAYQTGADISNLVFDDKDLGVKISGSGVTGITDADAANMTYYLEKYDEATGKWISQNGAEGQKFASVADIQQKVGSWVLNPGERVFICGIPYTVEEANLGDMFSNNLYVSATYGGKTQLEPRLAPTRVKVVDIQDKTFVVDFAGNLRVRAEQLFSESELANDVDLVSVTNGTYGTATIGTANSLEYTMTSALNAADEVKITERFPGVSFTDDMTGKEYEYIYSATKNIKLVPANNVYYDDSFAGIEYTGWQETTGAGNVITGVKGTDEIYGNTTDEARFTGKSHFIEGSDDVNKATAKFKFTGDGLSVYMNTTATSGKIVVTTQKLKADGSKDGGALLDMLDVKSLDNYEGVPVVNRTVLKGYGTYEVTVTASIPAGTTASLAGIRVYNPMNNAEDLGIYADTEKDAKFYEIRDNLKNATDLSSVELTDGSFYIDGDGNVTDYIAQGPKNEIYLKPGAAVGFQITNPQAKVYVGARSLKVGETVGLNGREITSTLDMFYDVTASANENGVYVIKNTGNGVLALTNVKITGAPSARMVVSSDVVTQALAMYNAPVEPEVPETPEEPDTPSKPQSPIQKFFEDVRNFFNKLFGKH